MYFAILHDALKYVLLYLFRFISLKKILTSWLVLPPTMQLICWQSVFWTVKSSLRSSCYVWMLPPGHGLMCRRRSKTAVTTARWVVSTTSPTWSSWRRTAWSSPRWLPQEGRRGLVHHKPCGRETLSDTTKHMSQISHKNHFYSQLAWNIANTVEINHQSINIVLTLIDLQSF